MVAFNGSQTWVLLSYRIPREPSTPRIAAWRALKRLGVAHIGDGLAALPADARTREQLDWLAEQIEEAGGSTTMWLAEMASPRQQQMIVAEMSMARDVEYTVVMAEAQTLLQQFTANELDRPHAIRRLKALRSQMRQIQRRDYFAASLKDAARMALTDLSDAVLASEVDKTMTLVSSARRAYP